MHIKLQEIVIKFFKKQITYVSTLRYQVCASSTVTMMMTMTMAVLLVGMAVLLVGTFIAS